jgi:hypothetical protein
MRRLCARNGGGPRESQGDLRLAFRGHGLAHDASWKMIKVVWNPSRFFPPDESRPISRFFINEVSPVGNHGANATMRKLDEE